VVRRQPSNLDYFEVIYTLCDLLEHVYKKFMATEVNTQTAKSIVKLDTRFKVRPYPLLHTDHCARRLGHILMMECAHVLDSSRSCVLCAVTVPAQHHLLSPISKDTTAVAVNVLKHQMNALDAIFASSGWETEGSTDE
jgi:hypothetical protein